MSLETKSTRTFELNNEVLIPAIGFGTWKSKPEDAYESVKAALQAGYRHIDTAFVSSYPPKSKDRSCGTKRSERR